MTRPSDHRHQQLFRLIIPNVSAVQAKSLKGEGNEYFKEKNYEKAILAYSGALKKKCDDDELNTVLFTNRAAAHFHLGNLEKICSDIHTGFHAWSDTRCVHTFLILPGFCCTGNMRSALNDAAAAKKIKPNHLKALIRGNTQHARFPLAI